jgi:hypothetical protein
VAATAAAAVPEAEPTAAAVPEAEPTAASETETAAPTPPPAEEV